MIGVLDSGIGGLSVVNALWHRRPSAALAYLADTAHLPYGDSPAEAIREWTLEMARFLCDQNPVSVLVVACNSATAAAVESLRDTVRMPVVAIEPPVKPAVAMSRTGTIGVLATRQTSDSPRLRSLIATHANGCGVVVEPCPGLAESIEANYPDDRSILPILTEKIARLRESGADVVALGCTHYSLVAKTIQDIAADTMTVADPADAVAQRVLALAPDTPTGNVRWMATSDSEALARAAGALFNTSVNVHRLRWDEGRLIGYAED
jgi:glutamate racemase